MKLGNIGVGNRYYINFGLGIVRHAKCLAKTEGGNVVVKLDTSRMEIIIHPKDILAEIPPRKKFLGIF